MIKSQDNLNDCNEGKRKSDVLIASIEKCERLERKLKIAVKALNFYSVPLSALSPYYNVASHHKTAVEALNKIREGEEEAITSAKYTS